MQINTYIRRTFQILFFGLSFFFYSHAHSSQCLIFNDFDMSQKEYDRLLFMCTRLASNIQSDNSTIKIYLTNKLKYPNAYAAFDKNQRVIIVTEKMLKLHNYDPSLLAFVFGHEMGHLMLGHPKPETFFNKLLDSLKSGALTALKVDQTPIGSTMNFSLKGYESKFSQSQELAADTYAYALILNSGYTKNDALSSLEILNKYSDTSEWHNFFSTHPDTKKRIRNIQMQ